MSAEDRDRLKKVTELAKQQVDGQQSHSNSDKSKPPALRHEQPQAWPQTSSKFSLEREFELFVNVGSYLVLQDTLLLLSNLTLTITVL